MTRLMTGARPTGSLHIGQFFAAFQPFVTSDLQDGSFFVVSDLHMMTTKFTPAATRGLPAATRRLVAEAIAFGVDPGRTTFYLQSSVQWQARIYVILQSLAGKHRLEQHGSFLEMGSASAAPPPPTLGLLGYPVLESSDVLSIAATHVTVGESNRSHFNHLAELLAELNDGWGSDYEVPRVVIGRPNLVGIDGSAKMSKSLANAIYFSDSNDAIRGKMARVATVDASTGRPVAATYLDVLGAPPDVVDQVADEIRARRCVPDQVRDELTDRLVALVEPVNLRAGQLVAEPDTIDDLLRRGARRAEPLGAAAYERLVATVGLLTL